MKVWIIDGEPYRLPDSLTAFEREMYVHLIKWKWARVTREPGLHPTKEPRIPYDAILPDEYRSLGAEPHISLGAAPHVHPSVRPHLAAHHRLNPFRVHPHFFHMASSQAANINLFLPVLLHPRGSGILAGLPGAPADFAAIATDQLFGGFCLEYWGKNGTSPSPRGGLLGDKTGRTGTDADIAIAYRNQAGELRLWLIEHKLVEQEFTTCGGYRSEGRTDKARHDCTRSFTEILANKAICYYHDKNHYRYWELTEAHREVFSGAVPAGACPFQGGLNQLWRNQLLASAVAAEGRPFRGVHFSVVRHPDNRGLDDSLKAWQALNGSPSTFSVLSSRDVLDAAARHADEPLDEWIGWYSDLYRVPLSRITVATPAGATHA